MVKAQPMDVEAQVIPLHQQIQDKKKELMVLEAQMDDFKTQLLKQLGSMGIDSIKKGGYTFSTVQKTNKVFNVPMATKQIEESGLPKEYFYRIDQDVFEAQFPSSQAIEKVPTIKYLSIRKAS